MPVIPSCKICGRRRGPQTVVRDAVYCVECANRQGLTAMPYPASRAAKVRLTEVWKFHGGQLEQLLLDEPTPRLIVGNAVLPVWYVTPKSGATYIGLVYATKPPPSEVLDEIGRQALDRWKNEPWLQVGTELNVGSA